MATAHDRCCFCSRRSICASKRTNNCSWIKPPVLLLNKKTHLSFSPSIIRLFAFPLHVLILFVACVTGPFQIEVHSLRICVHNQTCSEKPSWVILAMQKPYSCCIFGPKLDANLGVAPSLLESRLPPKKPNKKNHRGNIRVQQQQHRVNHRLHTMES